MEAKTEGEEKKEIEEDDLIDNDRLEAILNRFDERTQLQEMLHNYMSDGFMSLARERYRDASSIERKCFAVVPVVLRHEKGDN